MARGSSGRLVIEVSPDLKEHLYAQLMAEGVTLKEWFTSRVEAYLRERDPQVNLWAGERPTEGAGGSL